MEPNRDKIQFVKQRVVTKWTSDGIWHPSPQQSPIIDMLAMGYSQNAAARRYGVSQPTISGWINTDAHALDFQAEIRRRAELFLENLGAIEDQQVIIATQLFGRILAGEVEADAYGNLPPE